MGRTAYVCAAAAAALCLVWCGTGPGPVAGELPSLEVAEDAPRLEEPGEEEQEKKEGPETDNQHCFVCHGNYRGESLTEVHASAGIGCMQCHGSSDDHRGDEANITPPDRMFPADKINAYCRNCHDEHDVEPEKMMDRWLDRAPHRTGTDRTVCTDCHGEHRLHSRDTRWDKTTGELLHPLDLKLPESADPYSHGDVFAPKDGQLLSAGKPVQSSAEKILDGSLDAVTNGRTVSGGEPAVTLPGGTQWIQIDLGTTARVYAVMVSHAPDTNRAYRDVIVRLSRDAEFGNEARTVFNNDVDNSSGLGRGLDARRREGQNGTLIKVDGAKARYVRLYSRGNSQNERNHYADVRVYGITPASNDGSEH